MQHTTSRSYTLALTLLFGVLLLNGVVAYNNIARLVSAERWVIHTVEVRRELSEAEVAVVAAETAERGFTLTGHPSYLHEYQDALRDAHSALTTLRELVRDNNDQLIRLDGLAADVQKASVWFSSVMAARTDRGLQAAQTMIADGRTVGLTRRVRNGVDEMDNAEDALLSVRRAEAEAHLRQTILALVILTLASIGLAAFVVRAVRRAAYHRAAAQEAVFSANHMLRAVLDTIPQRVFWKDRDSRYLGANLQFARDAGFDGPEHLLGKSDAELAYGAHAAAYRADDIAVMESGGEKLGYEEPTQRPDGSTGWLETSKVPLRDMRGNVIGVLGTYEDITARKAAEHELERQANFDSLTGLPNRNLLADRIDREMAHAKRTRGVFAVAMMDLDNFKLANDGHGHAFGDRLLVEAARRLQGAIRAEDTAARYGGDEFVLVLPCRGDERFVIVLERVRAAMAQPFVVDGAEYFCTCSIGATTFPQDGIDAATLLSHADAAMYRAKERGRNCIAVFETEMGNRIRERVALERGLRAALEEDQLLLHYQPQLNLKTGRVDGVEALVRWKHPEQGLIPPGRFIPVAEQSGLIVPMGAWILKAACMQAKKWNDGPLAPLTVAVNLSALQLRQKGFLELVTTILAETGLEGRHLELEITESLLMSEADDALALLNDLSAMGIQLSIDDFGTGYSSLSYLKRLPVDKLKIDQSFVRDIPGNADDVAIAKAIVSLSRSLELSVIAEGVETEAQCEFMRSLGCDEIQGYYFARPMEPKQLERMLSERALA